MLTHPEQAEALSARAHALYDELRDAIETPDNIGKIVVLDVESGDYEIDQLGIESSQKLLTRHPGAELFALRIGFKTAVSFCGGLERNAA